MGKTIRISDEDYEKAAAIISTSRETMGELFARSLTLLENEGGVDQAEDSQRQKELKLLYRIVRAVCPLTEEDSDDPDFGIKLEEVYKDMNLHPEKYRE